MVQLSRIYLPELSVLFILNRLWPKDLHELKLDN